MKTQRLHPILVRSVVNTLYEIFEEGRFADKAIQYTLKSNPKAGSSDRAFIAESCYDIVRWWRLLWFMSGKRIDVTEENLWEIFGIYWLHKGNTLPKWEEFKKIDPIRIQNRFEKSRENLAVRESIPDWLNELGIEELGLEKWDEEVSSMNYEASVFLRVNSLKTTTRELLQTLREQDIQAYRFENIENCVSLKERLNLFGLEIFKQGWFELQDSGSQLIGNFLGVKPGMRVIDACAGAGGKTLQLAALMENKGRIISMDVEEWKLTELKRRTRRAGVGIVETKVIEGTKTIKRLEETADRLLLDVPCSGLGVLKRNPDAKWKLDLDFIQRIQKTQAEILDYYPKMLKKGGLMVYATCSILPSENHNQVKNFLENNPNFELIEEKQVWPSQKIYDGFYMALIRKN